MIFYFSATGNSKWAAIKFAQATHDRLVYIPDVINSNCCFTIQEQERVGFVFPVHGWRIPKIVRAVIKKFTLTFDSETITSEEHTSHLIPLTYALCTAGDDIGLTIDKYLPELISQNTSLNQLGIKKVDSAYSLIMPESYVGLPFMDVDPKEKEISKKSESEKRLQLICEEVFNREKGIYRLDRGNWPWINSNIIGAFFDKYLVNDGPFHINSNRCVRCGICSNVCPVEDILGGLGNLPSWKHNGNCLTCFNCYHHCPHHAIEYGKQTKNKGQYY